MISDRRAAAPARQPRLPRVVATACALFGIGFFFHTSHEPVVLGKYSLRYLLVPGAWYLVIAPVTYFVLRFLCQSTDLVLPSRRRITIPPRSKLSWALVVALVSYLAIDAYIRQVLVRSTTTFSADAFHPYLQNLPRPNNPQLHTNRWGFRGEDIGKRKPPGTFRIFVLGGSTVLCSTVPFAQCHTRLLEKRLSAAYPNRKIEVQNLGAEWHTSQHSVMRVLFEAQEFSPDMVICFHGINDLCCSFAPNAFSDAPYRGDYGHYYGPAAALAKAENKTAYFIRSAAGHWFSDFLSQGVRLDGPDGRGLKGLRVMFFPNAKTVDVENWPSLSSFERNMRNLVEIAQSKKIRMVLATMPSLYRDDLTQRERDVLIFSISQQFDGKQASLGSMKRGMALFNETTRKIALDHAVALVELDAVMPKTLEYFYDDVHYTAKGNALVGEELARYVIRSGAIGQRSPNR